MSLRVIHGKPGSGKSCYCVSLLVKMLTDWVRFEKENDEPYSRILYINIPLDIEKVSEYVTDAVGFKADVSKYIEVLDDTFFRAQNGDYREWWLDFEEKGFIVIDEVHHYLPASVRRKKGGADLADKFMNYVSTHRHRQHDLIFLTQHIDNVSQEIKKQAEVVYEVLNIKNTTMGVWPFVVQMQDVDVVRESWGYPVQLAHIKRGICEARSVKYDKNYEVFILSASLFALYRSHTMSDEALDRPSLRLGKLGSLVWFGRRYFQKFFIWAMVLVTVIISGKRFIENIPTILMSSLAPGYSKSSVSVPSDSSVTIPSALPSVPLDHVHGADCVHDHGEPILAPLLENDEILGFVIGGVITRKGTLRKDDHIMIEGDKDFVKQVDVLKGILYLGSGKKVQK
jgi:hypothetical protein